MAFVREICESELAEAVASSFDLDRLRGASPILVVHQDPTAATGRPIGPLRGIVVIAVASPADAATATSATASSVAPTGPTAPTRGFAETETTDVAGLRWGAMADVLIGGGMDGDLARLTEAIEGSPHAAVALVELLRSTELLPPDLGLVAESSTYSMLQAGPEHARWLDERRRRSRRPAPRVETVGAAVDLQRDGDALIVTLSRPERHNAYSATMRDSLVEALELAVADPDVSSILLRGAGPSWCSGGDLDEFGTSADPASAHRIRLDRSAASLLWQLRDRVTVHLHGAAIGAGIELAAVAANVIAAPSTRISLPEVGLGLVPGAGGTVSITRRVGRQRTAWLALTGARLDAATALSWGLVDRIDASIDERMASPAQ